VELGYFIECIEKALSKKAIKNMLPMQQGDVPATFADIDDLKKDVGFRPTVTVDEAVNRFVAWYKSYYSPEKKS
jgi:UDP-glucuronate 4-epimerase